MKRLVLPLLYNDDHVQSSIWVIVSERGPWNITCEFPNGWRTFSGYDLFEALNELRLMLQSRGESLLCMGARLDVFPSSMSRDMSGGRKAYICPMGKPATQMVDIFDRSEIDKVATVEEQQLYHERWIKSLQAAR